MPSQLYVAYSAQLALERRLETIANNMANISSAGYRAEEVSFEEIVSRTSQEGVSFVSRGKEHLSLRSAETVSTGNPFDIAVRGDAWLAIQTQAGPAYTRDGRLRLSETGELQTVTGFPLLDTSGSPLQLDPNGPAPMISADGTVTQNTARVGSIGLFTMDPDAKLRRGAGSSVTPDLEPTAELDFNRNGIAQGVIEQSNVSPIAELSRLIALQRSFEAVTSMIRESETALQEAMRALSGAS